MSLALTSAHADASSEGDGGIQLVLVGRDFVSPTHVAQPPGERERLFVVERHGRVRVLEGGRVMVHPLLDIHRSVSTRGLQGMFSIAFHPRYRRNGRFYVHYTGRGGGINVVEYRARRGRAVRSSRRVLLYVPRPGPGVGGHYGGQLAFGRDGRLYASTGDGGGVGDPGEHAQDLSSPLGKLFRIDVDRPVTEPEIVGYGLRNPWRFSFDRATGDLYLGDVGERRWEEIDFVPRRRLDLVNFGWDAYEGRARFEPERPDPSGRLVFPIAQYRHAGRAASVTGGFVYRGAALPALRGRYFYGDASTGRIWSFRSRRGKAVEHRRERFLVPGIVSFGEDSKGELYIVSFGGGVYRMAGR